MSCDTNDKVTELPASINLLTPNEPLMEEEDMLREVACLKNDEVEDDDDENGNGSSCDATTTMDDDATLNNNIISHPHHHHHHPKLSITMPSSMVVEISQNFYWPLYAKPIDWIYEDHISSSLHESDLMKVSRKVAEELHSLQFFQQAQAISDTNHNNNNNNSSSTNHNTIDHDENDTNRISDAVSAEATIQKIISELLEEKEDWFNELSGGQKSKVELVRTVFIRDQCPDVLLIDETMAPLDPASKELVMAKLKLFCRSSIIIVIYHTDVSAGKENHDGKTIDCVPSSGFFDKNIHLEKGLIHTRETC
jgi:ABC-type dipeptide/oligopeptide/nickel transport system ATPase subunit